METTSKGEQTKAFRTVMENRGDAGGEQGS